MKTFPTGVIRHMGFTSRPSVVFDYATYPWVAGTVAQEFWGALQPTAPGDIDYSYLDGAVSQAAIDQKPVIFLIKTGGGSAAPNDAIPTWISGAPYTRPVPVISGDTNLWPWDHVAQGAFFDLVRHLGKRYDKNPWLRGIYLTGCACQYPEMHLKEDGEATPVWRNGVAAPTLIAAYAAGGAVYIDAWKRAANVFATAFPNTPVIAMLDQSPNPLATGTTNDILGFSGTDTEAGVLTYIETKPAWREQFFVGTANLKDDPLTMLMVEAPINAATTSARYGRLRTSPVQIAAPYTTPSVTVPVRLAAGIYYEIGFQLLTDTAGAIYRSFQAGRQVLGSRAIMISKSNWDDATVRNGLTYKQEARNASQDFWGL